MWRAAARRVSLSAMLKRLWRIELIRWAVWFPVICLLLVLVGYFFSDPLWWDWRELQSQWLWAMGLLGILGVAFILLPASLFHVADKWTVPKWRRDEHYVPWKGVLASVARIAGWIWVCCLVGFLLWTCFSDDWPPVQEGATLDGVTENQSRNLGYTVHHTPGSGYLCRKVVMAEKVSKNMYRVGCLDERTNERHLYQVRVDDDGYHWPAERIRGPSRP